MARLQVYLAEAHPPLNLQSLSLKQKNFNQAPTEIIETSLVKSVDRSLAMWLSRVLPAIRLLLHRTLGTSTDKELAEELFLVSGKLYVTSTHIDLVAGLDEISLPIRIAGLDADPGWLVDYSHVINFHFQ